LRAAAVLVSFALHLTVWWEEGIPSLLLLSFFLLLDLSAVAEEFAAAEKSDLHSFSSVALAASCCSCRASARVKARRCREDMSAGEGVGMEAGVSVSGIGAEDTDDGRDGGDCGDARS
jgi:hypothetical protein